MNEDRPEWVAIRTGKGSHVFTQNRPPRRLREVLDPRRELGVHACGHPVELLQVVHVGLVDQRGREALALRVVRGHQELHLLLQGIVLACLWIDGSKGAMLEMFSFMPTAGCTPPLRSLL